MNTRIKDLKIANYKNKIKADNHFLNIESIFYGSEDELNSQFCKVAANSEKSIVKKFNFYSIENGFEDESKKLKEAISYFKNKARDFFLDNDIIIFNLKYNDELFRVECMFRDFLLNFNKIKSLDETIFLFDKDRTKHISILRMEYNYEVILFKI